MQWAPGSHQTPTQSHLGDSLATHFNTIFVGLWDTLGRSLNFSIFAEGSMCCNFCKMQSTCLTAEVQCRYILEVRDTGHGYPSEIEDISNYIGSLLPKSKQQTESNGIEGFPSPSSTQTLWSSVKHLLGNT